MYLHTTSSTYVYCTNNNSANSGGGRWTLRVRRQWSARCWEILCLALIGDAFGLSTNDEICGIVYTVRYGQEHHLSVWNRSAQDKDAVTRIKQVMCRIFNIDPAHASNILEYRAHDQAIRSLQSHTYAKVY